MMKSSLSDFVEVITRESFELAETYKECVSDWLPEEPPITVLFAELGHCIVENLDKFSGPQLERLFHVIEDAMGGNDELLTTAVATGLIEGMVSGRAGIEAWPRISARLGHKSREHAEAWMG